MKVTFKSWQLNSEINLTSQGNGLLDPKVGMKFMVYDFDLILY